MTYRLLQVSLLIVLLSCGGSKQKKNQFSTSFAYATAQNYFKTTKKFVVEVFYEPGAEPYTDLPGIDLASVATGGFDLSKLNPSPWIFLSANLNYLFQYRSSPPSVVVPQTLASMKLLPAQNKTSWTLDQLVALYQSQASTNSTAEEAHFYIFFVNGYSSDGPQVIGLNINGSPVIAIFKDVIRSAGTDATKRYLEQSTLIHEMGHALGFVNAGVPMATAHQDTAHGNHTTDSECVMYWENEGMGSLVTFVQKIIKAKTLSMWGPEVLADAKAFSQ